MSSSPLRRWMRPLAEFASIVLGVLVALAVDQWVATQGDRRSEVEYVRALAVDLRSDSLLFAGVLIPIAARADSAIDIVAPVLRGRDPIPVDTLGLLRSIVASTGAFTRLGDRATFDELLATGSLRFIESSALRASIVSYYSDKDELEKITAWRASGYPEVVRSHIPGDPFVANTSDEDLRAVGLTRAVESILSGEFEGAMNRHENYLAHMRPRLERMGGRAAELLSELSTELELLERSGRPSEVARKP